MATPGRISPEGSLAKKWVDDMKSGDPAKVDAGKQAWEKLPSGVKRGWQTNVDVMAVVDEFGLKPEPSAPSAGRRKTRKSKKTKKAGKRKSRRAHSRRH